MPRLSVIIPTRRVDDALARRIDTSLRHLPDCEVLVVEPRPVPVDVPVSAAGNATAGSAEAPALPAAANVRRLTGARGRGTQCNAGARAAGGELLLFLHDDTELPANAAALIADAFADPDTAVACFRLRFDHPHPLLGVYGWFSRFDSYLTSFGDQGILVRRGLFDHLGGFPDWPLFEDVEFLRRARRRTRIRKLPAAVVTSAVRYVDNGVVRQQVLNASLMLRFALGATPEALLARYDRRRLRGREQR
jgi:GT2 family glycosyltransferase